MKIGIYTQNINNVYTAMRDITTGILYVNAGTIGAEVHLPFGGTSGTGNGHREVGTSAIDFCTSAVHCNGLRSITANMCHLRSTCSDCSSG